MRPPNSAGEITALTVASLVFAAAKRSTAAPGDKLSEFPVSA